jgi:hypothetical protein
MSRCQSSSGGNKGSGGCCGGAASGNNQFIHAAFVMTRINTLMKHPPRDVISLTISANKQAPMSQVECFSVVYGGRIGSQFPKRHKLSIVYR